MEDENLYSAARDIAHRYGMAWTDPRFGVTYQPPEPGAVRKPHIWIPSTLGHGDQMCSRCNATNLEIAAMGELDHCER